MTFLQLKNNLPNDYWYLFCGDDFFWYKALLDAQVKVHMKHIGEPIGYPCAVRTTQFGISECKHSFIYPTTKKEKCKHCGSLYDSKDDFTWG